MKKILRYLRSSLGYLYVCFKWVILAALVGCVVGPFGAMFGLALNKAPALRTAAPRLIYRPAHLCNHRHHPFVRRFQRP